MEIGLTEGLDAVINRVKCDWGQVVVTAERAGFAEFGLGRNKFRGRCCGNYDLVNAQRELEMARLRAERAQLELEARKCHSVVML